VCEAVDSVTRGGYTRAFCAVRPPGHHVGRVGKTKDVPSQGFCLLNNVAIGAKYALLTAGFERIAVIDFDVHHGNGTQELLEGDSNFMFYSIHVVDKRRFFYPGTGDADTSLEEGGLTLSGGCCGTGASGHKESEHSNVINVPLKRNSGSTTFLQAFTQKILLDLERFAPQIIFLSAGFDGHRDDPTNGLRLFEEDYYVITKQIKHVAKRFCEGRIISVLEGGYALEGKNCSFRRSVQAHLRALILDEDDYDETYQYPTAAAQKKLSRKNSFN